MLAGTTAGIGLQAHNYIGIIVTTKVVRLNLTNLTSARDYGPDFFARISAQNLFLVPMTTHCTCGMHVPVHVHPTKYIAGSILKQSCTLQKQSGCFNRAVATGAVGPVSTGPLSGALSHVFVVNQWLMAARTSFKVSLPSLPDTPHHLKDVAFPKRTFRKSNPCCALRGVSGSVPGHSCTVQSQRSRGNPLTCRSMR